jgi:hypothetical protein
MTKPRLAPLGRNRHVVLTVGTGTMALLTAIFLIGAPPIPATLGVGAAVAWLVWRGPRAS